MTFLLGIAAILVIVILILIFRIQGLLAIVRGSDNNPGGTLNKFNALLLLLSAFVGTFFFVYYSYTRFDVYTLPNPVSEHGLETDHLFWVTMSIISVAFIVFNAVLMIFAYKYQYKKGNKATFYPDNHVLELVWTIIPAIVLTYLVFNGWQVWSKTMSSPPAQLMNDKVEVEIVGQQFYWSVRYPGCDNVLGAYYYKNIDDDNSFGIKVSDFKSWDDFTPKQIVLPKGRPVHFNIRAKDVLHSVYLPHFRVKMDAMPGMPTEFWFTPIKTTREMRNELENQEFNYEMACTEMCGKGHYSMRYELVVLENDEYEEWLSESCKSSWALEKTPYVIKTLLSQGAPLKTVSSFLTFINQKDTAKAKVGIQAYFDDLKKNDDNSNIKIQSFTNSFKNLNPTIYNLLQNVSKSSINDSTKIQLPSSPSVSKLKETDLSNNDSKTTVTNVVLKSTDAKEPMNSYNSHSSKAVNK